MRQITIFVLFAMFFSSHVPGHAQENASLCDLIPNAREYFENDNDGSCRGMGYPQCPPGAVCQVLVGDTPNIFEYYFLLPVPETLPSDFCTLTTSNEITRDRIGDHSVTCESATRSENLLTGIYVMSGDLTYVIEVQGALLSEFDPIVLAEMFLGEDGSGSTSSQGSVSTNSDDAASTSQTLRSPFEDGIPEPPEAVDNLPALDACSERLDDAAQASCLAQLVRGTQDPSYCFAAVDVYACGQILLREIGEACETQTDISTSECYITLAAESGIEAACERLPSDAQAGCFVLAGSASGDYSILERRFGDDPDAQDYARTIFAVNRYDPLLVEDIQDNENYDLAKVMMIAPMGINGGVIYNRTYCDELRGNYDSEYPEDAILNYELCIYVVDTIQRYSDLETDAERGVFETELEEAIARMNAEFDKDF